MAELSKHVEGRSLPLRLPTLTGARFVAAASVFFFHALWQGFFASQNAAGKAESVFKQGGWAGVSFFFILSGFVLTWAAHTADRTAAFYRRRLFKIYPNHLVTGVVALLLLVLVANQAVKPGTALMNLLLIQAWSPDWMVRNSLNAPAWSLSCELLFYAAFPLLFALVKRIRPERLWAWATGVAAVAIIGVPVVATRLPHETILPVIGLSEAQFWFVMQFPPVRALEFVLGMLLARIVITGRRLPVGFGGAVALTVAAYALAPMFPQVFTITAITLIPLALVVATGAAADVRNRRSWLSSKIMVKLGELSFAFYLWHLIVLTYGDLWLGDKAYPTPVAIAVVALLFAISLALSYLLFTLVENPIMRTWSRPHRKHPVLESVPTGPEAGSDGPEETRQAS
ncbi:MAG TPA: acyltransferase [Actinophytocola sp.]|uniref:acyltransferase family protein n=1 Tax=Actinophytocola sp. TaxID=1872138 RepID=UPI002DDD56F3|nr:acyltransferase [Actinophytocola sp.]HEV2780121.1 acyltransferase [Actinophytocola sp.]